MDRVTFDPPIAITMTKSLVLPSKAKKRTPAERSLMFSDLHGNVKSKAFRKLRARKAALVMHAQGKTNTQAATSARWGSVTPDERRAQMRVLAAKSAEVRRLRAEERRGYEKQLELVSAQLTALRLSDVSVASRDA